MECEVGERGIGQFDHKGCVMRVEDCVQTQLILQTAFSRLNIQNRVVKFQVLKAGSYFQIYEFKDCADKECQGRRTQSAGGRAVRQAASSFSFSEFSQAGLEKQVKNTRWFKVSILMCIKEELRICEGE